MRLATRQRERACRTQSRVGLTTIHASQIPFESVDPCTWKQTRCATVPRPLALDGTNESSARDLLTRVLYVAASITVVVTLDGFVESALPRTDRHRTRLVVLSAQLHVAGHPARNPIQDLREVFPSRARIVNGELAFSTRPPSTSACNRFVTASCKSFNKCAVIRIPSPYQIGLRLCGAW